MPRGRRRADKPTCHPTDRNDRGWGLNEDGQLSAPSSDTGAPRRARLQAKLDRWLQPASRGR
jgi:hypothetical protein